MTALFCLNSLWSTVPSWSVKSSDFQYSMQVYAIAEIDGVELNNANDMLAAFSGGECRGVVTAQYNTFIKKQMFFLVAYANANNETLSFKVYDSVKDEVKSVVNSVAFQMNADAGSVIAPYVMSTEERVNGLEMVASHIQENTAIGTGVAQFIHYVNGTAMASTLSLVDGFADNNAFYIQGDSLMLNSSLNYEQKNQYTVKVLSQSASGNVTKTFTFEITDVNEPPTALILSEDSIDENTAIGSVLGLLSVVDEDAEDAFVYALQNASSFFEIVDNKLLVKANLNYEFMASHSLSIQVKDKGDNVLFANFEITVNDVNDAPSLLWLSADSIPAGLPEYMTVGCLSVFDEDEFDVPTLSLVEGEADNAFFMLNPISMHLISASTLSFTDGDSRIVKVKADDGRGGVLISDFNIKVMDKGYSYTDKKINVVFTDQAYYTHNFEVDGSLVNLAITNIDRFGRYRISSSTLVEQYELYSSEGRLLISNVINQMDFDLDISQLSMGSYIVRIFTENGIVAEHLLIAEE